MPMNMNWTIGKKLAAGFALALVLLLVVGVAAYWNIGLLVYNASMVAHTHKILEDLEAIASLLKDAETGQRGYLLTGQDSYLEPYRAGRKDVYLKIREVKNLTEDNQNQQQRLQALEPLIGDKLAELQATIDSRKKSDGFNALLLAFLEGKADAPKDAELRRQGEGFAAALNLVMTDKGKRIMDDIRRVLEEMSEEEKKLLDRRSREQEAAVQATKIIIVGVSLVSFLLLSAVGLFLTRTITRPLAAVMDMSRKIMDGNLRQDKLTVTTNDEIGRLAATFNNMLDSLRDLAVRTLQVTQSLNAATAQILASTQQQAASTKEQAATVQQITATMEEVGQSGAQITQKAKQVATAAEAASTASNEGLRAVQDTTRTMGSIREQVEEVAGNIVALSEKTLAVGETIATVNDIAERSNLLALNAAIEAAGAGEHGSRFSVVASEMKNLADQAKDSTVQVRTTLGDIQKGITSSVMFTEEAVKRVEAGKKQAEVAEQTIRQMSRMTLESIQAFEQIIGASSQQQIGFDQVTQGMKDIRQAAGQTAAATVQLEKAMANLDTLSKELKQTVGRYQV